MAERLGEQVIEFQGVSKGFGDRLLIDDLSFIIPPGAIVGIIGPNGAGKSTLFKMITGEEKPDAGKVVIGQSVKLAFVDQSRENLSVRQDRLRGALGRRRPHHGRALRDAEPRLHRPLQLQGRRPAEDGGHALRRRARPAPPGQDPDDRRQRPAPRRALQRPRRGDPAGAGGRAPRVRRLRAGHLATTAGSSTASPRTSWPARATRSGPSSPATTRSTRPTSGGGWARRARSPTGSATSPSAGRARADAPAGPRHAG